MAQLATAVAKAEAEARARMLGRDRPDTRTVDVRFGIEPEPVHLDGLDEGAYGALSTIMEYYQSVPLNRLVILGEPGAGKTVLALELLRCLIDLQQKNPAEIATGLVGLVPVRFSLPTWEPDSQPLPQWLAEQLVEKYGLSRAMAETLVQDARILPILDGLDEMDPDDRPPTRAVAAVRHLNDYRHGFKRAPVVVICRHARYQALRESKGSGGGVDQAATAVIQPLIASQIRDYITDVLRTPRQRALWRPVLDDLDRHPHGPLARALNTPWRLTLATTVYSWDGDPAELLHATTEHDPRARLDSLLLGQFVPAATTLHQRTSRSGQPRPRYTAQQVTRWLTLLAGHLAEQAQAGRSGTDIVLHELWPLAGRRRVRVRHGLITATPLLALGAVLAFPMHPDYFPAFVLAAASLAFAAGGTSVTPHRFNRHALSKRSATEERSGFLELGVWVGGGLLFGLAGELAIEPTPTRLKFGLAAGFTAGLSGGLAARFSSDKTAEATPQHPLRNDRAFGLIAGLTFGLASGLMFWLPAGLPSGIASGTVGGLAAGFTGGLKFRHADWLTFGFAGGATAGLGAGLAGAHTGRLSDGLIFGLAVGVAAGLAIGITGGTVTGFAGGLVAAVVGGLVISLFRAHLVGFPISLAAGLTFGLTVALAYWMAAWTRYTIAVTALATCKRLPARLDTFLGWAYGAGLLRKSGVAYQFRHREFQDWLYTPPAPQTGATPVLREA